jgi:hypothetical protein
MYVMPAACGTPQAPYCCLTCAAWSGCLVLGSWHTVSPCCCGCRNTSGPVAGLGASRCQCHAHSSSILVMKPIRCWDCIRIGFSVLQLVFGPQVDADLAFTCQAISLTMISPSMHASKVVVAASACCVVLTRTRHTRRNPTLFLTLSKDLGWCCRSTKKLHKPLVRTSGYDCHDGMFLA